LDEKNKEKIGSLISDDVSRRQVDPIQVLAHGHDPKDVIPSVWDPPVEIDLVIIGGWHWVCALMTWLEENDINDEGHLGRWYATVYSQGVFILSDPFSFLILFSDIEKVPEFAFFVLDLNVRLPNLEASWRDKVTRDSKMSLSTEGPRVVP
jgi:hypothetical protein